MFKISRLLNAALFLIVGTAPVWAQSTMETDLSKDLFHVWDGVDAKAQPTTEATYFTMAIGTEVAAGGTVYGNGNVTNTQFADLTGYTKLKVTGTAGNTIRLLFNRQLDNTLTEKQITIGTDGTAEQVLVDMDAHPYVHLNAIKATWNGPVTISRLYVTKEVLPAPVLPALETTMFHTWDGVDATANQTSTKPNCVLALSTSLNQGDVVFGNSNVSNMEYANLAGYTKMVITGVAGSKLRVMFNRQLDNTLNEKSVTIGSDGRATIDLTNLDDKGYVHLNCIKVAWGATATVSAISLLTTYTTTISPVGYSSFCSNYNVTIPEGLTAFTATATTSSIKLAPITGNIIPAQTGVILKGTPSASYSMETTDLPAEVIASNDLTGAIKEVPYAANYYVLSGENGKAVFAPLAEGTNIPAGKAYLANLPAGAKSLVLDLGVSTAISQSHMTEPAASNAIYNLSGQQVDSNYKGIVIKNGKKFIIR